MNTNSEEFLIAANIVMKLASRPTDDEGIELYSLYKQAKFGDNNNEKPAFYEYINVRKWEGWRKYKGMEQYDAEVEYITLVNDLIQKYGVNNQ